MKTVISILIVLAIIGGGIFYFQNSADAPAPELEKNINNNDSSMPVNESPSPVTDNPSTTNPVARIIMNDSGFSPKELTITAGTKVDFVNEGNVPRWPASAKHPTHTVYPGSDIKKCNTGDAVNIFDACRDFKKGEVYSFTFNEKGTWAYHDHSNPTAFGKIIVE
jgi:plastocyanin